MNASIPPAEAGIEPTPPAARRGVLTGAAALSGLAGAGVAALAGLCCAGPLTVLLLGTSGAVAAAALAPYRLPLLAVSGVLIVGAYWRVRRGRATNGAACPTNVGRWMHRSVMIAAVAWIVGATLWFAAR